MLLTGTAETAMHSLPLGSIRPTGWLERQLRIQADGLSGHLDEFWPDVGQSKWIGGDAEGWERGPYWLDGVVPLAYLLDDGRLRAKVCHWIDTILAGQQEDGWLGPRADDHGGSGERVMDPWPIFVLLKAMSQYHEATGDERILPAMSRVLKRIDLLLDEKPLQSWAKMRWPDLAVSILWLYDQTGEEWLLSLFDKVARQGYSWHAHFDHFAYQEKQPQWLMENHVVNHAMALKEPAVLFARNSDRNESDVAARMMAVLDEFHGQATGIFTGDESLAGKDPSQGTELCAVVEYLFSLELLIEAFGEVAFADRLEKIAFNALPATFKPNMWAHQYDQQANQVICKIGDEVIYTNNGPDSNIYGLEPNFGCCTANLHQGWPKFASHLWMRTADGGVAAVAYAPCTVQFDHDGDPVHIEVDTNYPFEETVRIAVRVEGTVSFPLLLRIPGWAEGARIRVGDGPEQIVAPRTLHAVVREWSGTTCLQLQLPMPVRAQIRYHNAVAIERGPLVYSLQIGEQWKQVRGEAPHADWEVYPTTPWNYALAIDPEHPEASITFQTGPVGDCPFSPEGSPVRASVRGRQLPEWKLERTAAGPLPESPVHSTEPLEDLTLLPYGCTNLRVTEFPWLAEDQ